jgi:hypothetical protein
MNPDATETVTLSAELMALAYAPYYRILAAGYSSLAEFCDTHGWDLTVKQTYAILEREGH